MNVLLCLCCNNHRQDKSCYYIEGCLQFVEWYAYVDFAVETFQRFMMAIFSDMVEKCIDVFMDDFSVFGSSFDYCLSNLERVLQRCEESNLVLN